MFIKDSEIMPSLQQDLTFAYAEQVFVSQGIAFGEAQKVSLKLKTVSGVYTNLGLLLSDQCPHFIKAAVFKDAVDIEFAAKEDMLGSVLMQFIMIHRHNLSLRCTQIYSR